MYMQTNTATEDRRESLQGRVIAKDHGGSDRLFIISHNHPAIIGAIILWGRVVPPCTLRDDPESAEFLGCDAVRV